MTPWHIIVENVVNTMLNASQEFEKDKNKTEVFILNLVTLLLIKIFLG